MFTKIARNFLIICRAWSFTIAVVPITLGTAMAAKEGRVSFRLYLICLLGGMIIHGAANTLNDYFDLKHKIDTPFAPTALYRPHPVFTDIITKKQLLLISLSLFFVAFILGAYLAIFTSPIIWILLTAGFLLAIFYTACPKALKYVALGEPTVFLAFGPLMTEGAYCVQRLNLSVQALLVSLPIGLFTSLVLLADNLRDIDFDASAGVKTIATQLGKQRTLRLYSIATFLPYLLTIILISANIIKWPSIAVFLVLPFNIKLLKEFFNKIPNNAGEKTSKIAFIFGVLLVASIIFI